MAIVLNGDSGITDVNGTAAAPAITGTDTDTGLYFGTNTLGLSTGGAAAVTVDSSQNVGIGTSSPTSKLTVNSTSYAPISIQRSSGTNANTEIEFKQLSTSWYVGANDTNKFAFKYNDPDLNLSPNFVIDTSGNVGIGTSSPSATLDVRGQYFQKQNSDSQALGSISQWLLQRSSNDSRFGFGYSTVNSAWNITASYGSTGSFAPIAFLTSDTERMRIHSSGGVSIGNTTDSGAGNLNVSGTINGGYNNPSAGTTAMAFGSYKMVKVTPNATATYTTTVPPAGSTCQLIILTSGATSYTITFGTGFKTTGTLATGATSARYFIFNFVSDGTNVIEASRTVAIA